LHNSIRIKIIRGIKKTFFILILQKRIDLEKN